MPKNAKIFYCKKCDFTTSKLSNYNNHVLTRKHQNETNETKKMPNKPKCNLCSQMIRKIAYETLIDKKLVE